MWQNAEKSRQHRSRIVQTLNVPQRVRLRPSLAAALLDGIFEHPAGGLGATVEGQRSNGRVETSAIDFNGEVGAGG